MLLKSIQLTNFMSFGSATQALALLPLNVVIGPNGSGKSNLLEAINLLREIPRDLHDPIRKGGGIREWLHKGPTGVATTQASIEVTIPVRTVPGDWLEYFFMPITAPANAKTGATDLTYKITLAALGAKPDIVSESLLEHDTQGAGVVPCTHLHVSNGQAQVASAGTLQQLSGFEFDASQSLLSQRKDPRQYWAMTYTASAFSNIRLYREWSFGRDSRLRQPQPADAPNEHLAPDASNLGLVLNRLRREPAVKKRLLEALQVLYEGIDDFDVQIDGGTVQVFFHEGPNPIPATRLSDGTLRYLCLLAILCHPNPGPLVCIEEPELGLHPDVLPTLATLLKEASERTQIIVTTHSDVLVDALTDSPECILVAGRSDHGTLIERLDAEQLAPWLENYRLGQLWIRGQIGGTRW